MPSRIPRSVIDYGLLAWLENTRVRLPLKGMDCQFEVCGEVASVSIEQVYHNNNCSALNCVYTFPLPGNAAVYRCELQVGQRVIVARVEEEAQARKIYEEKVKAGHRASLVEVERDNLFTLSLGNVQPDDVIVVRFGYFQTLERAGQQVSLVIPFCPGERYIPGKPLWRRNAGEGTIADTRQVPGASRISPPRIDQMHPEAATLSVDGKISGLRVVEGSVTSPLHRILTQSWKDGLLVTLDLESAVPDRDFVIRWEEQTSDIPAVSLWIAESKDDAFALVRIKAPEEIAAADHLEQDHYFLVDRSGSMQGEKWTKTAQALKGFVQVLGARDRVWITFFESNFTDFSERPMRAHELLADPSFHDIAGIGTAGGTELLPALMHVLQVMEAQSLERAASVIVITDGQVGNEPEILKRMKQRPNVRVHAFGIDTAVNDAFLRTLTRQQNGRVVFQTPKDDLRNAISSLAGKLRRPVVTQLRLGKGWELAEGRLPDLHEGDIHTLALRRNGRGAKLELSGSLSGGGAWHAASQPIATMNPALRLLWARERITQLLDEDKTSKAITLSKEFNIICRGTAFIAWDPEEKVAVARQEIYNPTLEQASYGTRAYSFGGAKIAKRMGASSCNVRIGMPPPAAGSISANTDPILRKIQGSPFTTLFEKLGKLFGPAESGGLKPASLHQTLAKHPLFDSEKGAEFLVQLGVRIEEQDTGVVRVLAAIKRLITGLMKQRDDLEACRKLCERFIIEHVSSESSKQDLLRRLGEL